MRELWTNRKQILSGCVALLFTAGAFGFYGMESHYDTVLYFLTAFVVYRLICRGWSIKSTRIRWASLVFSALLTISFAVGHQIHIDAKPYFLNLSLLEWAYLLPFGGLIFVCVLNLIDWILVRSLAFSPPEQRISRKYWGICFLLTTFCWLPYFLIFYPGNISLDSFEVIQQALGVMPYANNHPIAFTAVVGMIIKAGMMAGDINFGIACFSLLHMLALACILSYVLYWMKSKGVPDWIILISGGYYMLNPVIATFSVTMWKDVLFSGCFLLLITFLYDVYESRGTLLCTKKGQCILSGISCFMSLWRNGIVAAVCVLILILAVCYRKYAKRFLPVTLAVVCLIFIVLGPVYGGLNLPGSHAAESLGIPLQQIGYTLEQNGKVDGESEAFLNQILPVSRWAEVYQPGGSDSIKFDSQFDTEFLDDHVGEFIRVWIKLLPSNFGTYVKAWLMNTQGYYHIGTYEIPVWYGIIPADGVAQMQIYRTDLIDAVLGTDIPARAVEAFFYFMDDLPVINIMYSIAANVWMVFLAIVIVCIQYPGKQYEALWFLIPLAVFWAIIMATTPVRCSFRYMFNFHLALPAVLMLMLRKREEMTN